jgi:predicted nuclease of predicted toxin-antitoxin system
MKLLFDANLAPGLVGRLSELYPDSSHVIEIGLQSTDTDIWKFALEYGFTIVSKDSDFQQRAFVRGAPPKVIFLKLGNCRTGVVESLLRQRLEQITNFLAEPTESLLVLP